MSRHGGDGPVGSGERLSGLGQEALAGRRGMDRVDGAVDQRDTECALQLADLLAQCGCTDIEPLRRATEVASSTTATR